MFELLLAPMLSYAFQLVDEVKSFVIIGIGKQQYFS
jgi:hypothetical protein